MSYLSEQQLNTLSLFGYLKLPALIKPEIESISQAFDHAFKKSYKEIIPWKHVVHNNKPRQILPQVTDKCPEINALLERPQITEIVSDILGQDYQLIGSDANIYDCGTRWHTDIVGLPYNCQNIKLIFYLDESEIDQDCFRVIPGSHTHTDKFAKQLKQHIKEPQQTLKIDMEDIPCQQIATQPGDVVIFDARVWHAVGYANKRRRAFSFLFGDKNYQPPEKGNTHLVQSYD